ncbi:MAG: sulfurtransferase TusA family protein [Methanosarcinaceae archaeon]|nr:sulfurtransferase TusA family protein [Methanosarcinaceae archaeon]
MSVLKLDITKSIDTCGDVCPMNMVKTKIALKDLNTGELLQVTLCGGEPIRNVSRSVKDEGHRIVKLDKQDDDTFIMFIEKGASD